MALYNVARYFVILIICLSVEYSFGQRRPNFHDFGVPQMPGMAGRHMHNQFAGPIHIPPMPKFDHQPFHMPKIDMKRIRDEVFREMQEEETKQKRKEKLGVEEISDLPCDIHDIMEYYFSIKSKVCSAVNKPLTDAERKEFDLLMSLEDEIHTFRSKASHQALQTNCNLLAKMRKKYGSIIEDMMTLSPASMKEMEEEIMKWMNVKPNKKRPVSSSTALASLSSRPFAGFKLKVLDLLREVFGEFTRCTGLHVPNLQMSNLDKFMKLELNKLDLNKLNKFKDF